MSDNQTGQVSNTAAETYEEFFVPALFQEWPERVLDAAHVKSGYRVLDVACGTGILARTAAERVGPEGSVVGLDINKGMLAVAENTAPQIKWKHGSAESIPFEDGSFDAVVSQFGLMFFEDRSAAIQEMARVLMPGKHLAVAVWDTLENTPGYASMAALLERLFGAQTAQALYSPYSLGNTKDLLPLFEGPNLQDVEIHTIDGTACFASINAWVFTDIKGWTLSDSINESQYQLLLAEAEKELQQYVLPDGTVKFRAPAHIVTATKK
jgi:ubiquinone/menaquinone biosynthesis C-methylase UbiE